MNMRNRKTQPTFLFKTLTTLFFLFLTQFLYSQTEGTLKDFRDDHSYKTIRIGNQVWMAENLKFEPKIGDSKLGTYKTYNNDVSKKDPLGYLYDYSTAKNICPLGWHLPNNEDWKELINHLDGENEAGGYLKKKDNLWKSKNTKTELSGFNALPGGYYEYTDKSFRYLGEAAYFWSATENETKNGAYFILIGHDSNKANFFQSLGDHEYSVRCIKNK